MSMTTENKPIDVLSLYPPNMRYDSLPIIFSDILEKGIAKFYTQQTESVVNLYNPDNPYYSPEYIISLLGGSEIAELLKDDIDKKTISMLYSGLIKQKGKPEAIETILKIIKIDYERFQLLRDRNGCVWLTIIVKNGVVVNVEDLVKFEKLAKKFLPTCVRLRTITNCTDIKDKVNEADSDWDFDISCHYLDNNFRLDDSNMDIDQGFNVLDSDLVVKFCHSFSHYVEIGYSASVDTYQEQAFSHFADCTATLDIRMDNNFTNDRNNLENIRYALTGEGK
nr:MAG TPA: hypothetical protein [Caudoviricetes sp.]